MRSCTYPAGEWLHALQRRRRIVDIVRAACFTLEGCEARVLLSVLPAGTRGWETVPGVIRNDGVETFVVEIEPGTAISRITFSNPATYLTAPASTELLDDGVGADRVAGDGIYTSGAFRYKTNNPFGMPSHYNYDESSPAGLFTTHVAEFTIHHLDSTTSRFLGQPSVGLLDRNIAAVTGQTLAPGIVATPHLVNVMATNKDTQKFIRSKASDLENVTKSIYNVLGDDYDFFMFISTYKIENQNWTARENFTAGIHSNAKVNFSGTGQGQYDSSSFYGSDGRLLGLNILDTYDRGMLSYNAVHEILHQWGAYTNLSFGLADGTAHYNINTSVGSILGGKMWVPNGDGSFTLNDDEGSGAGGHHASPLDLYLMGLIDASQLPPIYVANPATFDYFKKMQGEPITQAEIIRTVTAQDIIAAHGARTPAPAQAHKDFRLAFVAESNGRLLNPTELTYYQIMAEHFTKELPAAAPDPHVSHNWASISRFFGNGSTWRSDLTLPQAPTFTVSGTTYVDLNANGVREPGEPGLSPRTIFIDLDNDAALDTNERRVTTDASGGWALTDLDPGTYEICQVFVSGFAAIAPDDRCHTITLIDAGLADVDFGSFPVRFEGTAGDDHFYVRLDPTGSVVELYLNGPGGQPSYTFPPTRLQAYQILGRNGDDLLTVDFANGNPLPSLALLFLGEGDRFATGGPGDRLEVLGAGQTFGSASATITRDGKGLGYNLIEQIIVRDGTFNFTTPIPLVGLDVDDSAKATFAGPQLFTSLKVSGDARVIPSSNTVLLATRAVTMADTGSLDLADSDLIVQATPETRRAVLDAVAALVRRSRDGSPRWGGPGITSSRAAADALLGLVVVPNDDGSGTPLILNHPVLTGGTLNNQMVLVRLTYNGDANLDGIVDADDYFRIDSGFLAQASNPVYRDGDFNYDGIVDADDYFLIDSAFLGQGGAAAARANVAVSAAGAKATDTAIATRRSAKTRGRRSVGSGSRR